MKKGEEILGIIGLILSVIWGIFVFLIIKPIGFILSFLGRLLADVGSGVYGKLVQVLTFLAFGALVGFVGQLFK